MRNAARKQADTLQPFLAQRSNSCFALFCHIALHDDEIGDAAFVVTQWLDIPAHVKLRAVFAINNVFAFESSSFSEIRAQSLKREQDRFRSLEDTGIFPNDFPREITGQAGKSFVYVYDLRTGFLEIRVGNHDRFAQLRQCLLSSADRADTARPDQLGQNFLRRW